jgi:glycosyltransferase involved in cell wall biosynthesis
MIKKLFVDLPVRKMDYITAISQTTKDEVIKYTGCSEDKIRVIEVPLDENLQADKKNEFNAECPKILQVGTAPHKNILNVIRALEGINCRLFIIGKLDDETLALLKEKNVDYQNEFDLDEEAIMKHYQTADLTVFCSIAEGFGLPIIEAQAMQTPVVTSNINPMKEVAGKGALLVDPNNPLEIREAVKKIIGDKQLREELVSYGTENIKRYHHKVIAEKYEDLYREIFEKNQI